MTWTPTILSPGYVVQRLKDDGSISGDYLGVEYFTAMEEVDDSNPFTMNPKKALLFMSLHSAARVAEIEKAIVRVLTRDTELKEFRDASA